MSQEPRYHHHRSPRGQRKRRQAKPAASIFPWWLLYVCFVVYGSLVPLDFRPLPFAEAWEKFQHTPFLSLGAESRADWVANGVLYLPLGLLTAQLFAGAHRASALALGAALVFSFSLALAVEFAQLAFPPRTVSLNDILAEMIGSGLGVLLAAGWGERLRALMNTLAGDRERFADRLLKAYALGYFAFSLFPYDFLLSSTEMGKKLASDNLGWLIATSISDGNSAITAAKLFAEALAVAPLGFMMARRKQDRCPLPASQALMIGAGLGLVIEAAQFFVVSGVSQGISVLTRMAGMLAGALVWRARARLQPPRLAADIRRHGVWLGLIYLFALTAITGWFEHRWLSLDEALFNLQEVHFLPFYYHYYTTEQAALLSLASVWLMYAPIGIFAWASWYQPAWGMWVATLTAGVVETSKLFLEGLHPDPTNLFIAGLAAWVTVKLVRRLAILASRPVHAAPSSGPSRMISPSHEVHSAGATGPEVEVPEHEVVPESTPPAPLRLRSPTKWGYVALAACMVGVGWVVAGFPYQPILLGLLITGYAVLLWLHPHVLIAAVPAALPLLDLAPRSGRFYVDEFDLFLLVSLTLGLVRVAPSTYKTKPDWPFTLLATLLGASYLIGALHGLLPWQWLDANSFTSYYSPYNGLRIAKGALWAFLLYGLLQRFARAGTDVPRLFGQGLLIGLAGTVTWVLWERMAFPGVFNFTDVYRVTGPFSQMHVGGADQEAFLTLATPFLVWQIFTQSGWAARLAGIGLLMGTTYAVMVTFSRAAYAGFAVALTVALLAALAQTHMGRAGLVPLFKRGVATAALAGLALAIALPAFTGRFAQERLTQSGADLATRQAHWADAMAMRDPDWATTLFGMGLGRYPETHYWRSSEVRTAPYRLLTESGNTFLRMGSGSPLYVEQLVAVKPGEAYILKADVRSDQGDALLTVALCEKWLLTSARCVFQTVPIGTAGAWQGIQTQLVSGEIGDTPWFAARPVKLSIYNANTKAVVDVDNAQLLSVDGELLANGGFSKGMDRWFFSVDNDKPWHVWSLPVQVLFDQGWFGVITLGGFIALGLWRASYSAWRSQMAAGITLAALLGLVVVGSLNSLVDSPRILMLLLVLISLTGHRERTRRRRYRAQSGAYPHHFGGDVVTASRQPGGQASPIPPVLPTDAASRHGGHRI